MILIAVYRNKLPNSIIYSGIKICADFKKDSEPYLRTKIFPLPTTDEVFYRMSDFLY